MKRLLNYLADQDPLCYIGLAILVLSLAPAGWSYVTVVALLVAGMLANKK